MPVFRCLIHPTFGQEGQPEAQASDIVTLQNRLPSTNQFANKFFALTSLPYPIPYPVYCYVCKYRWQGKFSEPYRELEGCLSATSPIFQAFVIALLRIVNYHNRFDGI